MISNLSELCNYAKGKTEVASLNANSYISTENMLPDKGGITSASSLPDIAQTQAFVAGDVLVSNIRPYFKKIWFAEYDGGCSNDVLVFRAKEGTDKRFLYYVLSNDAFFDYSMATSKGTKMPRGDKVAIMNYEVPNYAYETQVKIANVLDGIDQKIKTNNKINQNLQKQAKTVFDSIINNTTQSERLSSFISIKHGFAFKGDGIAPEDNGIVLVTPGNFKIGGGFQENKCKFFHSEYSNDYVLQPNDLIITMTDLSKNGDTLGYGALVPCNSERVYLHNQRIGLVKFLTDTLPKDYVYWFLRSDYYHKCIVGSASGSTVKHTSPSRILEQIIPIPLVSDYDKILLLQIIDNTIARNELESIRLQRVRDVLLPRFMSGELDVTSIDI